MAGCDANDADRLLAPRPALPRRLHDALVLRGLQARSADVQALRVVRILACRVRTRVLEGSCINVEMCGYMHGWVHAWMGTYIGAWTYACFHGHVRCDVPSTKESPIGHTPVCHNGGMK